MTPAELSARYRNLLVALSRHVSLISNQAEQMRAETETESHNGRKAGLHCKANSLVKQACVISAMLYRNKPAMRYFFDTTNIDEIARKEIKRS